MTKNPIMHSSCLTFKSSHNFIYAKKNRKIKTFFLFFYFLQSIYDKQIKLKYSDDFFIIVLESIVIFSV